MDKILKLGVEEAAFSGSLGCGTTDLFRLIQDRVKLSKKTTPTSVVDSLDPHTVEDIVLDNHMQSHLWKYLAQLPEIEFRVASDREVGIKSKGKSKKTTTEAGETPGQTSQEKKTYPEPTKQYVSTLSLQEVEQIYDGRLRIVVESQVRNEFTLAKRLPSTKLTPILQNILDTICSSRQKGITQMEISKACNVDPRSTHYYLKSLISEEIIVKTPITHEGSNTSLLIHKKYCNFNPSYLDHVHTQNAVQNEDHDELAEKVLSSIPLATEQEEDDEVGLNADRVKLKICTLLNASQNKVLLATDLMVALGLTEGKKRRWFNRTLEKLAKDGCVEKFNVTKRNEMGEEVKGSDRAVRLIEMFDAKKKRTHPSVDSPMPGMDMEMDTDEPKEELVLYGEASIVMDLSLEAQIMRLIHLSGTNGITAAELRHNLNNISPKFLSKILERIMCTTTKKSKVFAKNTREKLGMGSLEGVARMGEFVGRERRYRYYTKWAFDKVMGRDEGDEEMANNEESMSQGQSSAMTLSSAVKVEESMITPATTPTPYSQDTQSMEVDMSSDITSTQPSQAKDLSAPTNVTNLENITPDTSPRVSAKQLSIIEEAMSMQVDTVPSNGTGDREKGKEKEVVVQTDASAVIPKKTETATKNVVYNVASITTMRRKAYLISLLEHAKILELNYVLLQTFNEYASEAEGQLKYKIDKKTIRRLADSLESEGKAKVVTVAIPNFAGGEKQHSMLVHPSVDINGQFFNTFLQGMRERSVLFGKASIKSLGPAADIKVERLDDIVRRKQMEGQFGGASSQLDKSQLMQTGPLPEEHQDMEMSSYMDVVPTSVPSTVESSLPTADLIKTTLAQFDAKKQQVNSSIYYIAIAQEYGYLSGKIMRARVMHTYLLDHVTRVKPLAPFLNALDPCDLPNNGVIEAVSLWREMDLDTFLKVVGHRWESPLLKTFLKEPNARSMLLKELPQNVRSLLLHGKNRMRAKLKELFAVLIELRLMKVLLHAVRDSKSQVSNDAIEQQYQLLSDVPLLDFQSSPPNEIRRMILQSAADFKSYWSQLEQMCLDAETYLKAKRTEEERVEDEKQMLATEGKFRKPRRTVKPIRIETLPYGHPLEYLFYRRSWTSFFPITPESKRLIEAHIDRRSGRTPLGNEDVIQNLSAATRVPVSRLKLLFYRIESEAKRRHKARRPGRRLTEERKRARRLALDEAERQQFMMQQNRSKDLRAASPQTDTQRKKKIPRMRYSAEDDEALLRAAVIAKNFFPMPSRTWPRIISILRGKVDYESRPQRLLTSRFGRMMKNPEMKHHYDQLVSLFKENLASAPVQAPAVPVDEDDEETARMSPMNKENEEDGTEEDIVEKRHRERELNQQLQLYRWFCELCEGHIFEQFSDITESAPPLTEQPSVSTGALPSAFEKIIETFAVEIADTSNSTTQIASVRRRMMLLISQPNLLGMSTGPQISNDAVAKEKGNTVDSMKLDLVKSVIVMVMMVPKQQYDAEAAYSLLASFPNYLLQAALEDMMARGIVTKLKEVGHIRKIPGRPLALSDKFYHPFKNGTFSSNLVRDAVAARQSIVNGDFSEFRIMRSIRGGEMLFLAEALNTAKISLRPLFTSNLGPSEDEFEIDFNVIVNTSAGFDTESNPLSPKGHKRAADASEENAMEATEDKRPHAMKPPMSTHQSAALEKDVWTLSRDEQLEYGLRKIEKVIMHESTELKSTLQTLFKAIFNSLETGMTLDEIQTIVHEQQETIEHVYLARLSQIHIANNFNLVSRVGFKEFRWVAFASLGDWSMPVCLQDKSRARPSTGTDIVEMLEEMEHDSPSVSADRSVQWDTFEGAKKERCYVPARMWYDLHGNVNNDALRTALRAVCTTIATNPGIYASSIVDRLSSSFTFCETHELLEMLLSSGSIRIESIWKPHDLDIFSESLFYDRDPEQGCEKVQCYFVNPEWYSSMYAEANSVESQSANPSLPTIASC